MGQCILTKSACLSGSDRQVVHSKVCMCVCVYSSESFLTDWYLPKVIKIYIHKSQVQLIYKLFIFQLIDVFEEYREIAKLFSNKFM